ncbi:MAG: hypothetical protein Q8N55_02870 [bacterium]|nr:hypothetical protein [bacterium]
MCIQFYYNQKQENDEEIKLDLLKEIKDVGIDEWNEQVSEEAEKNNAKSE